MPFGNISTFTNDSFQISKSIMDALSPITENLNIYSPLVLFSFGLIGFFGNLFTYLQPELRSNTCCIYSVCGAVFDIINLSLNLFPKYFNYKYGIYIPWLILSGLCKLSLFLLTFLPHLPTNFLLLAIIDRFAATCNLTSPIRRILQLKMVPFMIILALVTSCLSAISTVFFHYDFYNFQCQSDQPIIGNILYIVEIGLIQPILMLIFVLLTYRNIRRSRQRVADQNVTNTPHYRTQFIVMIFGQIFTTAFITLQWIIFYIYFTLVLDDITTYEQYIIIFFVFAVTNNIYYLNNVKAFYISLLTSKLFRKTCVKGVKNLFLRYARARAQMSRTNTRVQTMTRNRQENKSRH